MGAAVGAFFGDAQGIRDKLFILGALGIHLDPGQFHGVHRLLQAACDGGFANARAAVGEALSYPEQRVTAGTAAALCGQSFAPLSVLLLEREEDRG